MLWTYKWYRSDGSAEPAAARGRHRRLVLPRPDAVGIDAIGVAIPRRFISLADLADARGVEPAKYTPGLGALEMAVAEPAEDTVSLAAEARPARARRAQLDPKQLGLLVVGTETGVDHSKPVASFVHGLLELPRAMRGLRYPARVLRRHRGTDRPRSNGSRRAPPRDGARS